MFACSSLPRSITGSDNRLEKFLSLGGVLFHNWSGDGGVEGVQEVGSTEKGQVIFTEIGQGMCTICRKPVSRGSRLEGIRISEGL